MTITLTHSSSLSRVEIALSALSDGVVKVERSTNEIFWETVRGGAALPISGGTAHLNDYEFVDGVENFYRVLTVDPPVGLLLPGGSGDYASTPNHSSLNISGPIDFRADVQAQAYNSVQTIIGKWLTSGSSNSYRMVTTADGKLGLRWSTNGSNSFTRNSDDPIPAPNGSRVSLRITWDGSAVRFFHGQTINGPWTPIAGEPSLGTSSFAGNRQLEIGSQSSGVNNRFTGSIFEVQVRNGINGPGVATPVFENEDGGTTVFTDGSGRQWTINGNAEIIGSFIDSNSITPSLNGQAWLKSIRYPFLNRPIKLLDRGQGIDRENRSSVSPVSGRSNPTAVHDLMGGQRFVHYIKTEGANHLAAARDLDLILASGDVFFIHVPKGVRAPGGYVTITGSSQERLYYASDSAPHVFEITCAVVNPPGPSIVGSTLTWGTIFNIYGSWNALLTANPTWADLLETVGSPDDVFTG